MKKNIIGILALLLVYLSYPINLFSQVNNGFTDLTSIFDERDYSPTSVSDRYAQLPEGVFSHAQIMNIPASSQADLLHKVLIIVDSILYSELTFEINRYAYDIHHVYGCNVIMERVASETCQDIKNLILNYQTNLDGCVFIGDIAPAFFQIGVDVCYFNRPTIWPCDLYYMDLTGTWTDNDHDNYFDTYSGDKKPEIFIGRISTANMGNLIDEIEGMRLYLKKNHKYWIGHRHINKRNGLMYTNADWQFDTEFLDSISYLYGNFYYDSCRPIDHSSFGKTDYLNRLKNNRYEFIQLSAHSYHYCHTPFVQNTTDTIFGNEIYNNSIKTLGFNLFCCSACCWTEDSKPNHAFLAGDYIYSPNSEGLCAVGSTKAGSMYPFEDFYKSLGSGYTMGQALVDWWSTYFMPTYTQQEILCWNFGLTIIGDPLVNFFHCTNSTCQDYIALTSYNSSNSPLSYYLASESITVAPTSGSFTIPVGDHCILNAPTVLINGEFLCPHGSTMEILNEGCRDNCDD
jgi:hypothetical protein